ncbi:MAG: hypothetical protein AB1324_02785 [Candidatus Micrarchaeota archaeon]
MRWVGVVVAMILITLSSAAVIESGDNGAQFVEETAAAKCQEPDVQAVYKCLGNVVRVVSSVPGGGSTFYKPEGKVVECPVVAPSEMGAECLQMMTPNYCPTEEVCGESPAPEVFPGQNDTPEQVGDSDYYIVEGGAASDSLPAAEPAPEALAKPKTASTAGNTNELEALPAAKSNVDWPLGYMAAVILLLGVGAVGVLFFMFRSSLTEDEA